MPRNPHSTAWRPISSSTPSHAIHPYSPRWLKPPSSVQADLSRTPRVKGFLPVPRDIFPPSTPPEHKKQPEYLAAATPEPTRRRALPPFQPDTAQRLEHEALLAKARRRNFREGVESLALRRMRETRDRAGRSRRKLAERTRRLAEPERDDEVLTAPSIPRVVREALAPGDGHRDWAARERDVAGRSAKWEAKQRRLVQRRMGLVHELYLRARGFIVREEQLRRAVEEAFGPDDMPVKWRDGLSVWALGAPAGTKGLRGESVRPGLDTTLAEQKGRMLDERMKRIVGELTGGRIAEKEK